MSDERIRERRQQARETLNDESIRSFFLAYVREEEDWDEDEVDIEWEKAHDVAGEEAQTRNGLLAGALILAMAEEGGHSIDQVAVAAKRNAEMIAESADTGIDGPE